MQMTLQHAQILEEKINYSLLAYLICMSGIHVYIPYERTPHILSTTKHKKSTIPELVKDLQIIQNKINDNKSNKTCLC